MSRAPVILALTLACLCGTAGAGAPVAQPPAGDRVASLPLVVLPAPGRGDTLAVLYSGDGGWAGLDRGVAQGLVRAGVPVVGYNSLRYFWRPRTPQEAADDLAAVLRHYLAATGKTRVILAGYSFGADALPSIVPYLPADLRARIRLVALMGLERDGKLEFQVADWLHVPDPAAQPIAPKLVALRGLNTVCIYGDRDGEAACPAFRSAMTSAVRMPGNHHYDGDYAGLARTILRAAGL